MTTFRLAGLVCLSLGLAAACGADESSDTPGAPGASDAGASTGASSGGPSSSSSSGSTDAAAAADATAPDGSAAGLPECGARATAPNPWIASEFAGVPVLEGTFTKRTFVELPRLVRGASVTGGKYGFDFREDEAPADPRAALVDVRVSDLVSDDGFGGSIVTGNAPGATVFLSNVFFEPKWPAWEGYDTTNYDGMVLDGSKALYAEDLTVKNWNADSAADIKSDHAQFVCLKTEGNGNRTLRFWKAGPHYLVKSSVNNETGTIVWFKQCTGAKLNVFDSTFNGAPELPATKVKCDEGSSPEIVYLTVDPRTTGEMHPMFSAR